MSFTTYIESWSSPLTVLQQMINNNALTKNSRIVLAFASFNFDSIAYAPGGGTAIAAGALVELGTGAPDAPAATTLYMEMVGR